MTPVLIRKFLSHISYRKQVKRKLHNFNISLLASICVFMTVCILICSVLEYKIIPLAATMAESRVQYLASIYTNDAISKIMLQSNITYDQLYKVEKNSDGSISALTANIINMNSIKTKIMDEIQNNFLNLEEEIIKIPIGTLSGLNLFTGLGPSITIRVLSSGSCTMDFKSRFTSAGINQTKQEIYIEVISTVDIIMSGKKRQVSISNNVPVVETVVVGSVPDAYFSNAPVN